MQNEEPTYRRIGPTSGAQIFCAGSSVVQFGIAWPEVSAAFGQGVENWGLAGSGPEIWEVSQLLEPNTNLMIIGISVHDLNEHYLCDTRANIVGIGQTIQDLWRLKVDWSFSRRLLGQYALAWTRMVFPTAGKTDAVLVALRRKLLATAGFAPTNADQANVLVLPSEPLLNFGESTERMSDWPEGRAIRRLALLRAQIRGQHGFNGPKRLALLRMLDRARQHGRIIVVVMPVAPTYTRELLTPEMIRAYEQALADLERAAPEARWVRLDKLAAVDSDEYYSDFVHLNGAGRRIVTRVFLREVADLLGRP